MGKSLVQSYLAQIIHDIFKFSTIWHRQSVAALLFGVGGYQKVDWKCWWYKHVTSTTLAFIKMSEKHKSPLPSAIQVKNQWKTIGNEETLDAITWLEQGKWSTDMLRKARLAHSSISTVVIMLEELQKVLSQNLSVWVVRLPQSYQNEPYQKLWKSVSSNFISL